MTSTKKFQQQKLENQSIRKPVLALAPMAGFTDLPFRLICKQYGADLLFSEMISATGLFYENRAKSLQLAQSCPEDSPLILQLFGSDPAHFAFATQLIDKLPTKTLDQRVPPFVKPACRRGRGVRGIEKDTPKENDLDKKALTPKFAKNKSIKEPERLIFKKFPGKGEYRSEAYLRYDERDAETLTPKFAKNKPFRPEGIDLNLGCPVKKVLRQGAGCALMEKPRLVREILKSILGNTDLPVSIKIRAQGKRLDALKFLDALADLNWQLVTVHARSLAQGFSGNPDWNLAREIKRNFPHKTVLANGGIVDVPTAQKALEESQADGLALARGVLGNPWLFNQIKASLSQLPLLKDISSGAGAGLKPAPMKKDVGAGYGLPTPPRNLQTHPPSLTQIKATALQHARLYQQVFPDSDLKPLRAHLIWYFKNFPGAKQIRSCLTGVETLEELEKILR
jgi:tRNA-dihydrouridine synthase